MKKILIVLFVLLTSCGIEYDGGTKIVVKGKITTSDNLPLENQEVNLYVSRDDAYIPFLYYSPSETNFIGKTLTNRNGEYTIVIPKPTNNFSEIIVETNSNSNNLNRKQFRNIQNSNFTNFELILPNSILFNKSDLTILSIELNNVNPENELKKIELIGILPNEIEFINSLENEEYFFDFNRLVKKNQTIVLRYTVFNYNTNATTIQDENIIIDGSNEITYTLNF